METLAMAEELEVVAVVEPTAAADSSKESGGETDCTHRQRTDLCRCCEPNSKTIATATSVVRIGYRRASCSRDRCSKLPPVVLGGASEDMAKRWPDDPIIIASFLAAPLLVPFRFSHPHPDGDLGSLCWRRCKLPSADSFATTAGAAVVLRGPESSGYLVLNPPVVLPTLVALPSPRKGAADLSVEPARRAAQSQIVTALQAGAGGVVVLNGIPHMPGGSTNFSGKSWATKIFVDALRITKKRAVFVGRHAEYADQALKRLASVEGKHRTDATLNPLKAKQGGAGLLLGLALACSLPDVTMGLPLRSHFFALELHPKY